MLCSRCSQKVRPVVALDIDGTLGDYHGHFFEFMIGYAGKIINDPEVFCGGVAYSQYICETFEVSLDEFRNAKLAYRQGALKRTMPLFAGADTLAQKIHKRAELWITTTRPYLRLDNIDPDTREWLDRNDIPYDGLLYHVDKYTVLGDRVDPHRVVAVLDDLAENLEEVGCRFGPNVPIQYATTFNSADRIETVAHSHTESYAMILERIEHWERHNG